MERTQSTSSTGPSAREGKSRAELLELVEKHSVRCTVAPNQVTTPTRELVRHGWVVEIYASRSKEERALSADEAIGVDHEVLEDILHAVLPSATEDIHVRVDPFIGAIHMQPNQEHVPEVRLRIVIEPHTETDPVAGAKGDTALLETLRAGLIDLGVRQSS